MDERDARGMFYARSELKRGVILPDGSVRVWCVFDYTKPSGEMTRFLVRRRKGMVDESIFVGIVYRACASEPMTLDEFCGRYDLAGINFNWASSFDGYAELESFYEDGVSDVIFVRDGTDKASIIAAMKEAWGPLSELREDPLSSEDAIMCIR